MQLDLSKNDLMEVSSKECSFVIENAKKHQVGNAVDQ